jgi:hypothetical protein
MTAETADKPRVRGINTKTTVADIAAHKDAIAVFAYAVSAHDVHFMRDAHGHKEQWSSIAEDLAHIAKQAAGECIGQPIRLNLGDAQTAWYVRDGGFAVVVVLAKGSTLGKSVLRMARRAMKTMGAADKMEAVRGKVIADSAVARDTLPSTVPRPDMALTRSAW